MTRLDVVMWSLLSLSSAERGKAQPALTEPSCTAIFDVEGVMCKFSRLSACLLSLLAVASGGRKLSELAAFGGETLFRLRGRSALGAAPRPPSPGASASAREARNLPRPT